jgi:transcription initiation factor IIE alpha subunit
MNKIDFFNKVAYIMWDDFTEEDFGTLTEDNIQTLQDIIKYLLSDKIVVFRDKKYKKLYDLLVEEEIVEPIYKPEAEEKLKIILG